MKQSRCQECWNWKFTLLISCEPRCRSWRYVFLWEIVDSKLWLFTLWYRITFWSGGANFKGFWLLSGPGNRRWGSKRKRRGGAPKLAENEVNQRRGHVRTGGLARIHAFWSWTSQIFWNKLILAPPTGHSIWISSESVPNLFLLQHCQNSYHTLLASFFGWV